MIEFKNVYKTYPNGFTALKDINLKIEQGEFVAIIGLSGAGKSTILRCINRMHDISKGELTVDGVDVGIKPFVRLSRRCESESKHQSGHPLSFHAILLFNVFYIYIAKLKKKTRSVPIGEENIKERLPRQSNQRKEVLLLGELPR